MSFSDIQHVNQKDNFKKNNNNRLDGMTHSPHECSPFRSTTKMNCR